MCPQAYPDQAFLTRSLGCSDHICINNSVLIPANTGNRWIMETNSHKAFKCLFPPSGKITRAGEEAELNVPFLWDPQSDTTGGEKTSNGMFSPAAGITAGDIGPKMNFEHIDNGFLMLQNVRVPRENMLNKFCEVCSSQTRPSDSRCAARKTAGTCLNLGQKSSFEVSARLWGFIRGGSYLIPKWNSVSGIPHSEVGYHGAGRTYLSQEQKDSSCQMDMFHPSHIQTPAVLQTAEDFNVHFALCMEITQPS